MPVRTAALWIALTSVPALPPPAINGSGSSTWTWIAYWQGWLWVCWDQREVERGDAAWERLPLDLTGTLAAVADDEISIDGFEEADEVDEVDGYGAGGRPRVAVTGVPPAAVLAADLVAFGSDDGRAWLVHRDGTIELAQDAGWDLSAFDLSPLARPVCGTHGRVPHASGNALVFRDDGCEATTLCGGPGVVPSRQPPVVSVSLAIEAWHARTLDGRLSSSALLDSPGMRQASADVGVGLSLRGTFDVGRSQRRRWSSATVQRSVVHRVPAQVRDPFGAREAAALRRIACDGGRP